jgi:hypothetical protein
MKTGGIFMKKKWINTALFFGAVFVLFSGVPGLVEAKTVGNKQDAGGNLTINNESGQDVILFINGEANRRIPSAVGRLFRVKMTEAMSLQNNNQTVEVRLYPSGVFPKKNNLSLTPENKDKTIYVQQIRHTELAEFNVEKSTVDSIISSTQAVKPTQAEFNIYLPQSSQEVLVELYSNPSCTVRLAQGSVRPGETLRVFRNPAESTELAIYAKYIRNDGKSNEELARGLVLPAIIVRGDGIPVDVMLPARYQDLGGMISGPNVVRATTATLIIENTRPIDRAENNNIVVYLDSPNTRIERHADVKVTANGSLIGPRTKQTYVITPKGDGQTYRIFIHEMSSNRELATYDYKLSLGEVYYIAVPGAMPSSITSPTSILNKEAITRRVNFTSNVEGVSISFMLDSSSTDMSIGSNSYALLGTTDTSARHSLSGQVAPVVSSLTYEKAGNVKIIFQASKEGYVTQSKSVNLQMFIDAVNGYTVEPFVLEKSDF